MILFEGSTVSIPLETFELIKATLEEYEELCLYLAKIGRLSFIGDDSVAILEIPFENREKLERILADGFTRQFKTKITKIERVIWLDEQPKEFRIVNKTDGTVLECSCPVKITNRYETLLSDPEAIIECQVRTAFNEWRLVEWETVKSILSCSRR
jgi:hypothetical protein